MRRLTILIFTAFALAMALPSVAFAQEAPSVEELAGTLDTVWVMLAFMLVLFMQAGFAMLEVGFSSRTYARTI